MDIPEKISLKMIHISWTYWMTDQYPYKIFTPWHHPVNTPPDLILTHNKDHDNFYKSQDDKTQIFLDDTKTTQITPKSNNVAYFLGNNLLIPQHNY